MMTDLSYTKTGMFTRFYANTPAGEIVWREMAKDGGVAAVLNPCAKNVIAQIRKAGYSVSKEKKSEQTIEEILTELGALI